MFAEKVPESLAEYQASAYEQAKKLRAAPQETAVRALVAELRAFFTESLGDLAYVIALEIQRVKDNEPDGEDWKK